MNQNQKEIDWHIKQSRKKVKAVNHDPNCSKK